MIKGLNFLNLLVSLTILILHFPLKRNHKTHVYQGKKLNTENKNGEF